MKPSDWVKKARKLSEKHDALRRDPRFRRTLGFLVGKGFLVANDMPSNKTTNLDIMDAIWVGTHLEPRVFEVLPAAMLQFPRSFTSLKNLPIDLAGVLAALKKREKNGPSWRGVPYEKLLGWANMQVSDGRAVPLSERKISKSFRLRPEVVDMIKENARTRGISEGRYIEEKVLGTSNPIHIDGMSLSEAILSERRS